eukprot:PhF_6_TR9764/c0_g1_i1/m.15047
MFYNHNVSKQILGTGWYVFNGTIPNATATSTLYGVRDSLLPINVTNVTINIQQCWRILNATGTTGGYYLSDGLADVVRRWNYSSSSNQQQLLLDLVHDKNYFTDKHSELVIQFWIWFGVFVGIGVMCCMFHAYAVHIHEDEEYFDEHFMVMFLVVWGCVFLGGVICMIVFGGACLKGVPYCTLSYGSSLALLICGCVILFFLICFVA